MKDLVQAFIKDESGATMVEYAVLVALIAVGLIAAVIYLRGAINDAFTEVADCLKDPQGCGAEEDGG